MKPRARHVVPRVTCHACSVRSAGIRHGAEAEVSLRRVRAGTWGGSGSSYDPCIGAPPRHQKVVLARGNSRKNEVGARDPQHAPPGWFFASLFSENAKLRIKSDSDFIY
jgi:hypothetical protein